MATATIRQGPETEVFLGIPMLVCSEAMRQVMLWAKRVAQTNVAVHVSGESGTGKELVARAIHHYSLRGHMPWVDINCGALPEQLVESELFGHEKGAFSGADQTKQGLFELANGGTLFFDEVGELERKTQVKLLRVLDGVPHYRVGGTRKIAVDVRIIAATNQDLEQACAEGRFRSDLYHRLNQFHVRVPPLRERPEAIALLAELFLRQHDPAMRFAPDVVEVLQHYPWPGNIRELRNAVIGAAILAGNRELRISDLPDKILNASHQPRLEQLSKIEEMERQMILQALTQTGGHHRKAAEMLGISRRTLSRKLRQYGVDDEYNVRAIS
jgi:DNA-binding NtrC family response regulator